LFFAAALSFWGCSSSNQMETTTNQCYYDYATTKGALPDFEGKLFWSPDSSGPRLDVYVSVRESRLRFDRDSNSFVASYTCSIHVSGKVPLSKEVDRRIVLGSYPKSEQNAYDAFLVSFPISGGEHTVQIVINDNESRARFAKTYSVDVTEIFDKPLVLSNVMLLARYDTVGHATKITPFILSNVGLLSDTLNFFTVLSSKESSEDSIFFYVYMLRSRYLSTPTFNSQMPVYQSMTYDPCGEDVDTILVYERSAISSFKDGISFMFGSVRKPSPGNFLLKVLVKNGSGDSASTSLKFQVHDKNFPLVLDDLHDMVNSLIYIASSSEIKEIYAGRTDSSIKAGLIDFWKAHGGLAKMAQYYQRVGQANQFFSSCIEGWKTPMGIYYIVCGAPDNVECEGEWDERWDYYQSSNQTSMTVVFRLARETTNIEDRFYRIEQVYSNADLWDYYINEWRTPY
jgi:GWxTD domain-containing protein